MAGNKNYQSYRDELARLIPFLYKYEDDSGNVCCLIRCLNT